MGSAGTDTHGGYQVLHTYEESGVYDARVTVVDDDGGMDAADLHYGVTRIDVKPAVKNPAWDPIDDSDGDTSLVHGLIPVIIPSGPNFDATQIDVDTLRFFPGYAPEYNIELLEFDVTGDGLVDAIAHFSTWAARIRPTDDVCYITGELNDGTYFSAFDAIRVTGASGRIPDATNPPDTAASDTKFFVVDSQADSSFRYRADGTDNGSFPLESILTDPRGATANATGDTLWVVDGTNHLVEVHGPDGWLLGSWLAEGLDQPEGIATDGTDIWIVDAGLGQVFHYPDTAALRSMSAAPVESFPLHTDNTSPTGLATDGHLPLGQRRHGRSGLRLRRRWNLSPHLDPRSRKRRRFRHHQRPEWRNRPLGRRPRRPAGLPLRHGHRHNRRRPVGRQHLPAFGRQLKSGGDCRPAGSRRR